MIKTPIKIFIIILIILFSFSNISATEYHINESGHVTYSVSTTTTQTGSNSDGYDNWVGDMDAIYLDFDSYPYYDWSRTQIGIYSDQGKRIHEIHYCNDGCDEITYGESKCTDIIIDGDINATCCIWGKKAPIDEVGQEDKRPYYTIYIDYDEYSARSGSGEYSITFPTNAKFQFRCNDIGDRGQYDGNYHLGLKFDEHYLTQFATSYHKTKWAYSSGNVSDYWVYNYSYVDGVETAWLNVTKTGTSTKWNNLFYKSITEGETTQFNDNPESTFNTDNLSFNFIGYAQNITVNYSNIGEIITFTQPDETGEGDGATSEDCDGENSIKLYFVYQDDDGSIKDLKNVNFSYNFSCGSFEIEKDWYTIATSTSTIYGVNDYTTIYYNANHPDDYQSATEIYNTTGEIYVGDPLDKQTDVYITFYKVNETPSNIVDDPDNETWIDFYLQDGETYDILKNVKVELNDSQIDYTNDEGHSRFIVNKDQSYKATFSRDDYYSKTFEFNISEDMDKLINLQSTPNSNSGIQWEIKYLRITETVFNNSNINTELKLETKNYHVMNVFNKSEADYENGESGYDPVKYYTFYLRLIKDNEIINEQSFKLVKQQSYLENLLYPDYAYWKQSGYFAPQFKYEKTEKWNTSSEYKLNLISFNELTNTEYIEETIIIDIKNESKTNVSSSIGSSSGFGSTNEKMNTLIEILTSQTIIAFFIACIVGYKFGTKNQTMGVLAFLSIITIFSYEYWIDRSLMFIIALLSIGIVSQIINQKVNS